jgi:hypothetical protein
MCTLCLVKTKNDLNELDGRSGLGVFSHGDNLIELLLDSRAIISTDVFENFASFFISADGSQVAGRVWKHLDTCEEEKSRKTLESEEESPADCRVAVVHKGETKVEPIGD